MERQDYDYYEANAFSVRLEDITSSEGNANILKRLRDGDDNLKRLFLESYEMSYTVNFTISEGDDLGWLGYFIGKSRYLQVLHILYLSEGEGGELIDAFIEGIARNQSIRSLHFGRNIGDNGVAVLASGFRGIGSSLKELQLYDNAIGNDGLSALVAGLANCTSLEKLDLTGNDFALAATGLGSLSDWLQRNQMKLKELCLDSCRINDEGLQAFVEGAANHCERVDLSGNRSITASGLRSLSDTMQSESCRLEELFLFDSKFDVGLNIRDDGAEVLALALVGNKSLKCLRFDFDDDADRDLAWPAFCTSLCDTSSVNNTYLLSNHTLHELEIWGRARTWTRIEQWFLFHGHDVWNREDFPSDVRLLLQLNKEHPQHAARCKILMSHAHVDMVPFFQWKLKFLPLALAWFERATQCTTLSIHDNDPYLRRNVLEESDEAFQSRKLTALYEFVREMSMEVLKRREELIRVANSDEIARIEEEKTSLCEELERRDRQFKQIEEENKSLCEELERRDRQFKQIEEDNKSLCEELERRDRQIKQLEEEKTSLCEELERRDRQIKQIEEEKKSLCEELGRRDRQIKQVEEEKKSLCEELERRDRQIKQVEEENKRLMTLNPLLLLNLLLILSSVLWRQSVSTLFLILISAMISLMVSKRQIKQLEEENKRLTALQVEWFRASRDVHQQL
jgi:hypothetical protein